MGKFQNNNYTLEDITIYADVDQRVRSLAGLLIRHNLETALKMIEVELKISREDSCLLLCEVAGELAAIRHNPNVKQSTGDT